MASIFFIGCFLKVHLPIAKKNIIFIHVIGCLLFLFVAFFVSPVWPDLHRMLTMPGGRADLIFHLELLILFYLNYYFLLDKFYFTKRYLVYSLITLILLILFIPVMEAIVSHLTPHIRPRHHNGPGGPPPPPGWVNMFFFNRKLYIFFLVIVGTILVKTRNRLKIIEQEKAVTELSFLKAQINPHFLFNTLNSIYSLSLQKSDATPNAVVKLSGMMRYVLNEAQQNYVSLESEINYIKDYIDLQKLRMVDTVKLHFNVRGEFNSKKIAPLILISFIENAFKYGINAEEDSGILIEIVCEQNDLELKVLNNKVHTTMADTDNTKLGLINTRKRLNLIYPDSHILLIEETEKEYSVNLQIRLHA